MYDLQIIQGMWNTKISCIRDGKRIFFIVLVLLTCVTSFPNYLTARSHVFFQEMSEEEYWERVVAENSLDGYQRYMIEFPDGSHYEDAVEKVVTLRDEQAWQNAVAENTSAAYSRYLKIYPRGIHVDDARKELNLLAPPPAKPATRGANVVSAPAKEPSSRPSPSPPKPSPALANEPSEAEKEAMVWETALQSGNPEFFKQYLQYYPEGRYKVEAISKIPMEFSLTRSDSIDTMFILTVKYAEKPVNITSAELPSQTLSYLPEAPGTDGLSTRSRRRNTLEETRYFFWKEGDLTAFISEGDELTTEMVINVGNKDRYVLKLEDASGDSWNIELESKLPSLELLGVVGVDGTMDTAFFTLKGGVPEYYVRIVEEGEDVNNYLHEEILRKDRAENTWYLAKNDLVNTGTIPSGNYEVYVLDSRKLENIKYIRPLTIGSGLLVSNMNIYTYLLIPVVLLIIWMFLNWSKKSKDPYKSRRDTFRF